MSSSTKMGKTELSRFGGRNQELGFGDVETDINLLTLPVDVSRRN